MMENNTPKNIPDIARRPYWRNDRLDESKIDEHLIFEVDRETSWAFPRAHLIRFEWFRGVLPSGEAHNGRLELKFPNKTVTVDTNHPEELVETVLSGRFSVLVRANAFQFGDSFSYPQKFPKRLAEDTRAVFTGLIRIQ